MPGGSALRRQNILGKSPKPLWRLGFIHVLPLRPQVQDSLLSIGEAMSPNRPPAFTGLAVYYIPRDWS